MLEFLLKRLTSTPLGDLAELKAIKKVFHNTSHLKISATKSIIGHAMGAAGGMEAIATIKAVNTGWLHPTINQESSTQKSCVIYVSLVCGYADDKNARNGKKMKAMASSTSPKREIDPKKRIVISGMGLVSVFGSDIDVYYNKLLAAESGITLIDRFDTSDFAVRIAGQIRGFSSDGYIDGKDDRRLDDCWRYCLVAGKRALDDANLGKKAVDTVNYVNAHATSTRARDLPEVKAIKRVFNNTSELKTNSTKSIIGDGLGAAGGLEAIATIKAINTGWLHPTLNQDELEAEVTIDTVPNVKKQHKINVGDEGNGFFHFSKERNRSKEKRIVISGMGLVSVFGSDVDVYYNKLLAEESGITLIDRFDTSDFAVKIAGQIRGFSSGRMMIAGENQVLLECDCYLIPSVFRIWKMKSPLTLSQM
ncbi:hypothetical protein SASPL_143304 [Salvia splendens]|uniref:beta-ketoacyl-[acyl-carrier-protein] synthase I n=1 Tax=Salvia splendens TaxID=180675 RepID=A0A8X8WKM6_SALSN|nr:hypothetical protein SASPL_143304 [Salvia splendens]